MTAQHFLLTRNGETVATDKVGAHSGFAAWVRMMERMAATVGVERLHPTNDAGDRFEGGFALEGPFQVLR